MTRRRGSLVAAAALLAATALPLVAPAPTAAALPAQDGPLPVTVSIESLSPVAPLPKDLLVIRGTVANASARTVPAVTVRLRAGERPLPDRASLGVVAAGEWDDTGTIIDGTRSEQIPQLLPGQRAPFTISVPLATLDLGEPGAYLLVVEAQSDPGDGNLERVGLRQTMLPWFPDPAQTPTTGLVILWPLTEAPAVDSQGVLLTDQIPRAVGPGGRLRILLESGGTRGEAITWVVDPALLEIVNSMSDGYRELVGGDVVAGGAAGAARTWIDTLRGVASRSTVMALPYGAPDDTALVRGGQSRDVIVSITSAGPAVTELLRVPVTSTLAWPPNGFADEATLRTIANAAPRGVVLSSRQLPHTGPVTPSGTATLPGSAGSGVAVVADATLSGLLTGGARSESDSVLVRQRMICDLALIGLEDPALPRTVVMAPTVRWSPTSAFLNQVLTGVTSAPWIRPTTLPTLLGAETSSVPRSLARYPRRAQADELPVSYVTSIGAAQAASTLVADVVAGSGSLTRSLREALARSGSLWFRTDQATGSRIILGAQTRATRSLEGVRIVSQGTVTLPGEAGVIPISVANRLATPVTVGLSVRATPSVRLSTTPVAPVTIAPGTTVLVEVPAQVSGSEPVAVAVYLTSTSGVPFGEPASLSVGSSAYSRAAAWVVGAAFAVLVVMLLVNAIRRMRVARARARTAAESRATASVDGPSATMDR